MNIKVIQIERQKGRDKSLKKDSQIIRDEALVYAFDLSYDMGSKPIGV